MRSTESVDWLRTYLAERGPTPRQQIITDGGHHGHTRAVLDHAARGLGVKRVRTGTVAVWSLPARRPFATVSAAEIPDELLPTPPWFPFPHCPICDQRLWAITAYRHPHDPRGPLKLPLDDGRCPHCGCQLYDVPSPQADTMADFIRSMR